MAENIPEDNGGFGPFNGVVRIVRANRNKTIAVLVIFALLLLYSLSV